MSNKIIVSSVLVSAICGVFFNASVVTASTTLIRGTSSDSVYYLSGGKRWVFPNIATFTSWYPDFSGVTTFNDVDLRVVPLAGNVTYRPGVRLVKIQTDPKTYAVDRGGVLRWVTSEATAREIYGDGWNKKVDDVPDYLFADYKVGKPISSKADFDPAATTLAADSILADRVPDAITSIPIFTPTVQPVVTQQTQRDADQNVQEQLNTQAEARAEAERQQAQNDCEKARDAYFNIPAVSPEETDIQKQIDALNTQGNQEAAELSGQKGVMGPVINAQTQALLKMNAAQQEPLLTRLARLQAFTQATQAQAKEKMEAYCGISDDGTGACSYHGGVNCSVGSDFDGSVICNDGWRDSTVSYNSVIECR